MKTRPWRNQMTHMTGEPNKRCTLSQLVLAWTAAQPGVTHVLAGGRNLPQVTENAKAGELNLEAADLSRIRKDVIALGGTGKTITVRTPPVIYAEALGQVRRSNDAVVVQEWRSSPR